MIDATLQSFGKFGTITHVSLEQFSCVAIVTFSDILEAFKAKKFLHNFPLCKDNATLSVVFKKSLSPEEEKSSSASV